MTIQLSPHPKHETHLDDEFCHSHGEHIIPIRIRKPMWLSANDRLDWHAKARKTRTIRALAYTLTLKWAREHPGEYEQIANASRVKVVAVVHPLRRGINDPANASATVKPILDAMTDAHYWPDDNGQHLLGPDYRPALPTGTPDEYRIDLHITTYTDPDDTGPQHDQGEGE